MAQSKETNVSWAIFEATQKPGEKKENFAPIPQGSKAVIMAAFSDEEVAHAVAGEMTSKDWETQHDDGRLYLAYPIKKNTPFNFAFNDNVQPFDPEKHTASLDQFYLLDPETKEKVKSQLVHRETSQK